MRALQLIGDRKLELVDVPDPAAARRAAKCRFASRRSALNHLDVWGFRGMAFAKRKLPLVVGAEASGEIAAVGAGVTDFKAGDKVVDVWRDDLRPLRRLPRGPRQSVRECRRHHGLPSRRLRARPDQPAGAAGGPGARQACRCATPPARRSPSAPSSTCCSTMPSSSRARPSWCMPAAPASARSRSRWRRPSAAPSSPPSATTPRRKKPRRSGADHVINYKTERFEGVTRKLTAKKGVDVVFEHVGGEGFNASLLVPQARRPAGDLRLDRGAECRPSI